MPLGTPSPRQLGFLTGSFLLAFCVLFLQVGPDDDDRRMVMTQSAALQEKSSSPTPDDAPMESSALTESPVDAVPEPCAEVEETRRRTLVDIPGLEEEQRARYEEKDPAVKDVLATPGLDRNLSRLSMEPIQFLRNFKNPCWWEHHDAAARGQHEDPAATYKKVHWYQKKTFNPDAVALSADGRLRLRCLPYYYFIGVSKCATSDLLYYINQHPLVAAPFIRNFIYWNDLRWNAINFKDPHEKVMPLRRYSEALDEAAGEVLQWAEPLDARQEGDRPYHPLIIGDASPTYTYFIKNWERIPGNRGAEEPRYTAAHFMKQAVPQARIILNLRNPTDRLYSDYYFRRYAGANDPDNFHSRVVKALQIWNRCTEDYPLRYCAYNGTFGNYPTFLRAGVYYIFVRDWLSVFPRSQLHIVRFEDYVTDRDKVINDTFRFLGLDPSYRVCTEQTIQNKNTHKKSTLPMRNDTRRLLEDFYGPWNQRLAELLDDQAFLWPARGR